jgi:3alpha(or 20beta)-hydroxysteroid dehydrogenase
MPESLDGRVALVTGAASGIGAAVAHLLAERGARVVGLDLSPAVASCTWGRSVVGDVGDEGTVRGAVQSVLDTEGRLDVVVNNAGLARHAPVQHLDAGDLDLMWRVNVRGPMLLCREAFRAMAARNTGGQIVNVVSTAGLRGEPGESAYCGTKFAMRGFTEAIAEEGRLCGIRVHAVFPGGVDTPFWSTASATPLTERQRQGFMQPADVARAIVALLETDERVQGQSLVLRAAGDADREHIRSRMSRFDVATHA